MVECKRNDRGKKIGIKEIKREEIGGEEEELRAKRR